MIINLGNNCAIANILKKYNILELRSPFDSLIVNHNSLIDCLNNKFFDFTDKKYFIIQNIFNKFFEQI